MGDEGTSNSVAAIVATNVYLWLAASQPFGLR